MVLALSLSSALPNSSARAFADLPVSDEAMITNPMDDSVTIIYDLNKLKSRLQSVGPDDRPTFARQLSSRVIEHYLKTATKEEVAPLKSATVVLVYIGKRNEYDEPDLSSLVELGVAKAQLAKGQLSGDVGVNGEFKF